MPAHFEISSPFHTRGVIRIRHAERGPHVVIFGGTHGDEVSGVYAIERLLFDLMGGTLELLKGSLVLARANEQAILEKRRYLVSNLNRLYRPEYPSDVESTSYEYQRAQELKVILSACDYFLDLHSAPIADHPFIITRRNTADFFAKLGIPRIITGWEKFSDGTIAGDGEGYAAGHGAKAATLEAGSHFDPASIDVAYETSTRLLSLLGMTGPSTVQPSRRPEIFDIYAVQQKESDDFRYIGPIENFRHLKPGEAYAFQNAHQLTVAEDSYMLIPMVPEQTKLGEEVCYLGRKLSSQSRSRSEP
jgi:succinylglutamate desuccinylase